MLKNAHHNFREPRVTSSNVLLMSKNSPQPKDSSFTIRNKRKEKLQIFTLKKLEQKKKKLDIFASEMTETINRLSKKLAIHYLLFDLMINWLFVAAILFILIFSSILLSSLWCSLSSVMIIILKMWKLHFKHWFWLEACEGFPLKMCVIKVKLLLLISLHCHFLP